MKIKTAKMINKASKKVNSMFKKTIEGVVKPLGKIVESGFAQKFALALTTLMTLSIIILTVYEFISGNIADAIFQTALLLIVIALLAGELEDFTNDYLKNAEK